MSKVYKHFNFSFKFSIAGGKGESEGVAEEEHFCCSLFLVASPSIAKNEERNVRQLVDRPHSTPRLL
ncbi:hypothetical protein QUB60_11960 [Microcoleus sp. A2-C5]